MVTLGRYTRLYTFSGRGRRRADLDTAVVALTRRPAIPRLLRVAHVAYGGLGGHATVLMSFVEASPGTVDHPAVFYGVEPPQQELLAAWVQAGFEHRTVHKRSRSDLLGIWQVTRWLRQRDLDAVVFHATQPLFLAWLSRILSPTPLRRPVLMAVEHQANHLKSRRDWLLSIISTWVADAVVFLTPEYRDVALGRLGPLRGPARVAVIPNGVDTGRFRPPPTPRPVGSGDTLAIGMQSRLIAIKDHETLIRSAALLRERLPLQVHIAGSGDFRPALERLAERLGVGDVVIFHGPLDRQELIRLMAALDVYVHATLGETMSTAILQAMAMGLPIVASRVPGVVNLLTDDDTALLIPPRDPLALSEAVLRLASDRSLREELGRRARQQAVEAYDQRLTWERYAALIDELLAGAPIRLLRRGRIEQRLEAVISDVADSSRN